MFCPKCGTEMQIQLINEPTSLNPITTLLWLVLGFLTCGIGLVLIPILFRKKSKNSTYFICPKCGHRIKKLF